jgi:hypothetical protein
MALIPIPTVLAQVSAEQKAARLAICHACEHIKRQPIERCGKCGCPLASKTRFQRAHCPIGKW